jgi:geranylgeranyl pyrophosphate synthase
MTTKVANIYGPVAEDLALVEDTLDRIKHVENFPALSKMLAHVLAGGGKRLRPAIALLAGHFGTYDRDLHVPLAASRGRLRRCSRRRPRAARWSPAAARTSASRCARTG